MSTGIKPSCATCPSFLGTAQVQTKFRKAIGTPACGRYGTVLDSPKFTEASQTKALQERVASRCDSYGEPLPPEPREWDMYVAMPDVDIITGDAPGAVERDLCKTCASCVNFVRDDKVVSEMGWTTGLCAAKGKLILPNRQVYEARNCEWRAAGPVRISTAGIHLLPEYQSDFGIIDPVAEFLAAKEKDVPPDQYVTDKPLSSEDESAGIMAWRKISDPTDPSGDRHTFLPIYNIKFFPPDEQDLIPKSGDDEHPELYVDHFGGVYLAAVAWIELDETPAANGPAGVGKTELFRHLAYLMQVPFRRISITGSTELDDIAGKMHYEPSKGTYFVYGRLPLAWQRPGVICIDEPNTGPPDVWQFLRPLTDNSKQLVLDQNKGEVIKRHDDCYMGLAMNPAWDAKNVGAMEIGDADINRLFHVAVPLPPEGLEKEIIQSRVRLDGWELDKIRMTMLMNIAHDIRGLIEEGTLPISWAIRPQIKVARALRWFDTITAYRRAVADYLEPEAAEALLNAVRAHVTN